MDYLSTIASLSLKNSHLIVKKLNELKEYEHAEKLQSQIDILHTILADDNNLDLVLKVFKNLIRIELYDNIFHHPININQFKDKNGNIFLNARASIKQTSGKLKWISAYVGTIKDYPNGVNDKNAYEKGEGLIRKKLISHYFSGNSK